MAVIVKTDRAKWTAAMTHATGLAKHALAEQMLADSESFVPYSGGSIQSAGGLRESGHIVDGESGRVFIVWDTVYALYQWFGVRADGTHRVRHYTTPGTGRMWVDTAKARYAERWHAIAQKVFSEGL